jgi:hypothetical protein
MRDNAVTIPLMSNKVTKQSILNELTYFGFQDVGEGAISVAFNPLDAPNFMTEIKKDYKRELQKLKRKKKNLDDQTAGSMLGYASCVRYLSTGNLIVSFCRVVTMSQFTIYREKRCRKPNQVFQYAANDSAHELDIDVCKNAGSHIVLDNDGSHLLPHMNRFLLKYGLRATNISASAGSWYEITGEGNKEIHSGVTDVTVTLSKI